MTSKLSPQSNEVGDSVTMEKEGLKRSLSYLESSGVTIKAMVTDRHPQIQKFFREQKPDETSNIFLTCGMLKKVYYKDYCKSD